MAGTDVARQNNELAFRGNNSGLARKASNTIRLKDVRIMWRNFAGEQNQYNAPGQRNFVVFLTPEMGQAFREGGFNVKHLEPREPGEEGQDFVRVNVRLESNTPPNIWLVNSKGKRKLTEDLLPMADMVDILTTDISVSRYERKWPDGRTTVTPYLQTIFIFLREDELEQEYASIPEIGFAGSQDSDALYVEVTEDDIENDMETYDAEIVD